jgi:glycosyltransferase involved in cell wall biosynthesis
MEPRILYLARAIPQPSRESGSAQRVAAFLEQFERRHVAVLPYTAAVAAGPGGSSAAAVWHRVPLRVRGLRRDVVTAVSAATWTRSIRGQVDAFKPTVVYERAEYLDPSGALLARRLRVPHVLELHGLLADNVRSYYRSPLESLGAAYEKRRYRRASRTVVVSDSLAAWLRDEAGVPDAAVIPSGVDLAHDGAALEREAGQLRHAWQIADRFVVGWIGHPMPWQVPLLATIVRELDRVENVALVIVGSGQGVDELRAAAASVGYPVVFAGTQTGDDADAHVRTFDLGLFVDTRSLGLPVKLFQYGALSVPVLSSDVESMRLFDAGRDLVSFFDAGDVAGAVARARADPDRIARAERLRAVVELSHTWDAVVDQALDVIAEAQQRRRAT